MWVVSEGEGTISFVYIPRVVKQMAKCMKEVTVHEETKDVN